MKLIIGEIYQTKWGNLTYTGRYKGSNYNCCICQKDRWDTHEFVKGDPSNPLQVYHFGSECIKKFIGEGLCQLIKQ